VNSGRALGGVREATAGDVGTLVELMSEFYAESGFALDRRRARDAFAVLLDDARLGRVWLVERDVGAAAPRDVVGAGPRDAAGYVVVTFVYGMEYGGLMAFVDDFFVLPDARGRGLGTVALAAVRDRCTELDVRALWVQAGAGNAAAQAAYARAGFTPVDRQLLMLPLAVPTHETS
jgi:GNAT superfamily N-acetyltransferase